MVESLQTVLESFTRLEPVAVGENLATVASPLTFVLIGTGAFLLLLLSLILLRRGLLTGRRVGQSTTWGCGYAQPTSRIQYTASSFAQPLTDLFKPLLGTRKRILKPQGIFPPEAALETMTPDISNEEMYRPMFERAEAWLSRLRWLQHGNVQLYVLYIAATLIVLLVWKFR